MKPGDHPEFFRFPAPEGRSRESTIRLDAEGRFWHDGSLVEHAELAQAMHAWISRHPDDGRYILTNGYDWTYFTVDDAPYFVRSVRIDAGARRPRLSDGTRGALGPGGDARSGPTRRSTRAVKARRRGEARSRRSSPATRRRARAGAGRGRRGGSSASASGPARAADRRKSGARSARSSDSIPPLEMRLLIADKLHPRAIEELRTLPLEVVYEPEITKETLEAKLPGVGILVVRSTEVTAAGHREATQLNLIVRAGAEFSTIDVRAASQARHLRRQLPGQERGGGRRARRSALMIALDRRIPDAVASLRAGKWERAGVRQGRGAPRQDARHRRARRDRSRGRRAGAGVRAARGRLEPVAHAGEGRASSASSTRATIDGARGARRTSSRCTSPLTERTRQIVGKRVFELLPKRAMFINTARADLVDYGALREAVEDARAARRRSTSIPDEPRGTKTFASDLFSLDVTASGRASSTARRTSPRRPTRRSSPSRPRRCASSARSCSRGSCRTWSTCSPSSAARFQLVIRMVDKVGTFANVLAVIKRHGINVEEVTNTVFEGAVASCAKLRLIPRPSEACLSGDSRVRRGAPRRHGDAAEPGVKWRARTRLRARPRVSRWSRLAGCKPGGATRSDAGVDARAPIDAGPSEAGSSQRPRMPPPPTTGRSRRRRSDELNLRAQHLFEAIVRDNPDLGVGHPVPARRLRDRPRRDRSGQESGTRRSPPRFGAGSTRSTGRTRDSSARSSSRSRSAAR